LDLAFVYAGLGEKGEALNWLERVYDERTIYNVGMFTYHPLFATLREEPRFKALVEKIGLNGREPGRRQEGMFDPDEHCELQDQKHDKLSLSKIPRDQPHGAHHTPIKFVRGSHIPRSGFM